MEDGSRSTAKAFTNSRTLRTAKARRTYVKNGWDDNDEADDDDDDADAFREEVEATKGATDSATASAEDGVRDLLLEPLRPCFDADLPRAALIYEGS